MIKINLTTVFRRTERCYGFLFRPDLRNSFINPVRFVRFYVHNLFTFSPACLQTSCAIPCAVVVLLTHQRMLEWRMSDMGQQLHENKLLFLLTDTHFKPFRIFDKWAMLRACVHFWCIITYTNIFLCSHIRKRNITHLTLYSNKG